MFGIKKEQLIQVDYQIPDPLHRYEHTALNPSQQTLKLRPAVGLGHQNQQIYGFLTYRHTLGDQIELILDNIYGLIPMIYRNNRYIHSQ